MLSTNRVNVITGNAFQPSWRISKISHTAPAHSVVDAPDASSTVTARCCKSSLDENFEPAEVSKVANRSVGVHSSSRWCLAGSLGPFASCKLQSPTPKSSPIFPQGKKKVRLPTKHGGSVRQTSGEELYTVGHVRSRFWTHESILLGLQDYKIKILYEI